MTREEFRAKWSARRAEWEKLGVLLSADKLCEEFMTDFENVLTSQDEAVVNTNEAAAMTGYSRGSSAMYDCSCGTQEASTCSSGRGSAEETE
jgi:hypothetical protein